MSVTTVPRWARRMYVIGWIVPACAWTISDEFRIFLHNTRRSLRAEIAQALEFWR
jgi:hypothetical protein